MEHRLFILLLLTGVLPLVLSFSRLYFLIQKGESWSGGQAYCQANYTDLAIINSNEDMTNLQKVAQKQQFFSYAWIGLYTNINKWHWSFGNESVGNFTPWISGEPNNLLGNELCGFIYTAKWFDGPCTWVLNFICFDGRENATEKYVLVTQLNTWDEAQSYCRQHYTDLASARNETENSAIGAKNFGAYTWFGLRRDPWFWTDQTTNVSVIKWLPGNIEDYLQNKSCVYLYGSMADVEQCSKILPFFCYLYPTQQKIIRMKVKSSQDVNVPTMMAALEEKIKEKLKDYGMNGNITVTWRKQPDGVVFHKEEENITALSNTGDTSGP